MNGSAETIGRRMPCHGLVYVSIAQFPPRDVLLDIVRTSERANGDQGLSGMLCYSARRYVQYLEGAPAALDGLWRTLARDMRHRVVWMQRTGPAPRRIPARLPMGYASDLQLRELGLALPRADTAPDPAGAARLATILGAAAAGLYPTACADA